MGWPVHVNHIVCFTATCGVRDCDQEFEVRLDRRKAERDAEEHWKFHSDEWAALNATWEASWR